MAEAKGNLRGRLGLWFPILALHLELLGPLKNNLMLELGVDFVSSSSDDLGQPTHLTGKQTEAKTGQERLVNIEVGILSQLLEP